MPTPAKVFTLPKMGDAKIFGKCFEEIKAYKTLSAKFTSKIEEIQYLPKWMTKGQVLCEGLEFVENEITASLLDSVKKRYDEAPERANDKTLDQLRQEIKRKAAEKAKSQNNNN